MKYLTIAATALALSTGAASAATIIDTTAGASGFGGLTLGTFSAPNQAEPLGQTFTLTQDTENLMAGAFFGDVNAFTSPTFEVTISIFSGTLFSSATSLASQVFTFADDFVGFQSADFSGLGTLSAGDYIVGFSSNGNRGRLGTALSDFSGTQTLDSNGFFAPSSGNDFAVLVTGDAVGSTPSPVPIPASLPLLAAGLLGMGALARRKKSA